MASTTVTTATVTKILSGAPDVHTIWFQNSETDTDFHLKPKQTGSAPAFTTAEYILARATGANAPTTLIINDHAVCTWDWYCYQASGSDAAILSGQWQALIPS